MILKVKKSHFKLFIFSAFTLLAILTGVGSGIFLSYERDLPKISQLEDYRPNTMSIVYGINGEKIGEFAIEKRIPIAYSSIPDVLKYAIISAEDSRFFKHWGIDIWGILRAIKENIIAIRAKEGGSTITQQLARLLFLTPEKTLKRKIKEMLLSFQIEKNYTKEQIFTFYCNQIYLGHGVYGVEAASQFYFGKSAKELNLGEAALIASLHRSPQRYSPYINPNLSVSRRNWVLDRMKNEGYITKKEAVAEKKKPIILNPFPKQINDYSAYVLEEIRKYLEEKYDTRTIYEGGLKIYTGIDPIAQKLAEKYIKDGIRKIDKRQGWRKPQINLLENGVHDLENYKMSPWPRRFQEGEIYQGMTLLSEKDKALIRLGNLTGILDKKEIQWAGRDSIQRLIKKGDIVSVKIVTIDEKNNLAILSLEQEPIVEGAFIALDPRSGEIKAMVGGYSFHKSQFNRAVQALRQTGSAIKPLIYAAALQDGFTPASILIDEPITFFDRWTGKPWTPKNFKDSYKGLVTLRRGLEESRNVVTAKIVEKITPERTIEYIRKLGITSKLDPFMSLSLGSFEVSLLEMVSAFSSFINNGIRMKPYIIKRIEDMEGNILEENNVEAHEVMPAAYAYLITNLMEGVVKRGTATKALVLNRPIAGKTGTTNEFTDAWFIGSTPSLIAGVWVGFDEKKSLGENEVGARAALPIWIDFMKEYLENQPVENFTAPPNVVFIKIDRMTGLLATPYCSHVIEEAFIPGTEPTKFCSEQEHYKISDYFKTIQAIE
ncbi:MAG: PBP1A family penicillin-binding protein [Acidobacteriota bacterium]